MFRGGQGADHVPEDLADLRVGERDSLHVVGVEEGTDGVLGAKPVDLVTMRVRVRVRVRVSGRGRVRVWVRAEPVDHAPPEVPHAPLDPLG